MVQYGMVVALDGTVGTGYCVNCSFVVTLGADSTKFVGAGVIVSRFLTGTSALICLP